MRPKPAHLGPQYGAQFGDASVAAAYHHRPPYPEETFDILLGLLAGRPPIVLDAGCGTGDIARFLAPRVERVDAVDVSLPMIDAGRSLPGGDHRNIRWIYGALEDIPLYPATERHVTPAAIGPEPYGLVVAGESVHWMEWQTVLPRFRAVLVPGGVLAIVERRERDNPVWDSVLPVIQHYSTNRDYRPYDIVAELVTRNLFEPVGGRETQPVPFRQSADAYIESLHSRNGLSRDRMPGADADAFDREVRSILDAHGFGSDVELDVTATMRWGFPGSRQSG
jgi:SAM-dependent methyltransferase